MVQDESGFLSMKEFAKRNGLSYSLVKQLAREGKIPNAQPNPRGKRLIPPDALERMLAIPLAPDALEQMRRNEQGAR
jgi:excisionase family DNA binding protein